MRLGLIILLLICITITGVYATWTYAGTDDIADAFAEAKITITDTELAGANGTYKIESNLVLTIDQKADGDHTAELVFSGNDGKAPYLRVTFTPAKNAPEDIKLYGIDSELYFGTTTTMQYNIDANGNYKQDGTPTDILRFGNTGNNVFEPNIHKVHKENEECNHSNLAIHWTRNVADDGTITFTYEMDEAALKAAITLNYNFVLDTKAEHDAFRNALSGNIVVRITDGIIDGKPLTTN